MLLHHLNLTIRLFSVISGTLVGGSLTPLQRCSRCILKFQPTGQLMFFKTFLLIHYSALLGYIVTIQFVSAVHLHTVVCDLSLYLLLIARGCHKRQKMPNSVFEGLGSLIGGRVRYFGPSFGSVTLTQHAPSANSSQPDPSKSPQL